jgi:hypothetical protein
MCKAALILSGMGEFQIPSFKIFENANHAPFGRRFHRDLTAGYAGNKS